MNNIHQSWGPITKSPSEEYVQAETKSHIDFFMSPLKDTNVIKSDVMEFQDIRPSSLHLQRFVDSKTFFEQGPIIFVNITSNNEKVRLRIPLTVEVKKEDGYYSISLSEASIYVIEESAAKAIESFCEDFIFAWNNYAEADSALLTQDAIELKDWLIRNAEKV